MGKQKILVVGTGPAGLAAALALADNGSQVVLVGPAPSVSDRRTTALMRPAVEFLDQIGVGTDLREIAAPLSVMRIIDATNRLIRSPTVTFRASEIGEDFFGLNIPNATLNGALGEKVRNHPEIVWHQTMVQSWTCHADYVEVTLENGESVHSQLGVAADGRNSPARATAGIAVRSKTLPQHALILNFQHSRHHGFASTEFHTEFGPCTQVPLPGGYRSSLVWVTNPAEAERLQALDDTALSFELEQRQRSFLGKATVEQGRQIFPLSTVQPDCIGAKRIALVGEAAHVFPPITAQGLNLGMRDVMDLVKVIHKHDDDPGSDQAIRAYNRYRRADIIARSNAVNLVNNSLLSSFLPIQIARSAGLTMLNNIPILREIFMREGMHPGSGFAKFLPSSIRHMSS